MKDKKLPQAWIMAGLKGKEKVEARIDMSADVVGRGNCPECRQPMQVVTVAGTKMWACAADRITIPMPNDNETQSG